MRQYSVLMMLGLLSLLLIGVHLSASPMTTATLEAEQVKFEPKLFDLDNPEPVIAHIKFPEPYERNTTDVDPSTVRLEGAIPPLETQTTYAPPEFIAQFDGSLVAGILWSKIYHMGITTSKPWTPTKIELQVSGKLLDGTDWQGIGELKVLIPEA